jgi:PAS domain S-box-containing protein
MAWHNTIIRDKTGDIVGTLSSGEDISQRKQAEKALRESEETARALLNATTDLAVLIAPDGTLLAANEMAVQKSGGSLDELLGNKVEDFVSAEMIAEGTSKIRQIRKSMQATRFQAEWRNMIFDINVSPVLDAQGELARFAVFAHDITEQAKAHKAIEQHNRELAALNNIGLVVTSTLDLQETLTLIANHTTQLMGMAATSVALCDDTDDSIYFAAASGEGADFVVGQHMSMNQGIVGWVINHGVPALIPDVSKDERWHSEFDAQGDFVTISLLCVPLISKDRVIGALEAVNKPGGFTENDLHLFNALTGPIAAAIENARLFKEVDASRKQLQTLSRRLVEMQESERAHVARELHDETGQALSSMLLNLGLMEQETKQPKKVRARIEELIVMIDDMLENLHRLAVNLRPAALDHLGLVPALEQFVETFTQQYNIETQFDVIGLSDERLPPAMETALYRIVQESLTNTAKHAQATQADVLLTQQPDQVVVIIEDNGIGFDPEAAMQTSRLGLLGIRERAQMLDGKLVIESNPGTGTTVRIKVPYQSPQHDTS